MYTEPQLTTPMVSPPMSPKLDSAALPPGTRALRSAGNSGGCGGWLVRGSGRFETFGGLAKLAMCCVPTCFCRHPSRPSLGPPIPPHPASGPTEDGNGTSLKLAGRMGSYNSVSSAEASSALRSASPLDVHTAGAEPEAGASNIPGRPHIYPMPENPLALLRQLHELLKVRGGGGGRQGVVDAGFQAQGSVDGQT